MIAEIRIQPPTIYPSFDLDIPSIPQRSHFYCLPPIGTGTAYVESLTSYMHRLAEAHSVSFGSFYEYVLVPRLNKAYLTSSPKSGPASSLCGSFRERMKNINGVGKLAKEWAELLETLTLRSDLRFLSLIILRNVIPTWNLLRTFQAWCPECYEEMLQTKQVVYQPLLWTVAAVDVCARHRRPLVDRCPHCQRQLLPLTRRSQLGYCARCGHWLGESLDNRTITSALITEEAMAWRLFVTDSIADMLAGLPSMARPVTKETAVNSLHECILISAGGAITRFAKLIKKNQTTVCGWYQGKVRIPLRDVLRICYCLNLSILDFLSEAGSIRKNSVSFKSLPDVACIVICRRSPSPPDWSKVETALTNFLDMTPPISFAEAARRLTLNCGDLYRKFPELCRKISSKYRDYLQDIYRSERIKIEEEVRHAVIHLYSQGIYVSPRPVAEYLNKPSYLGRRDVAIIIRETRELLDAKRKPGYLLDSRAFSHPS